jgi:succinoglycan biosynthesis protein ExoL
MTLIAYFGHDVAEPANLRRVRQFLDDGIEVVGFQKRRGDSAEAPFPNYDLGKTADGAYLQRIWAIRTGIDAAIAHADVLASADLFYARNLDMLATAFGARDRLGLRTPVVYEALDVHRLLTRPDPIGLILRRIEHKYLKQTSGLVVSSPAYLRNYFEPRHRDAYFPTLLENRLAASAASLSRPTDLTPRPAGAPLRLGWVGKMRCRRSLDILVALARRMGGDKLEIHLHGNVAETEIPDLAGRIAGVGNIYHHGRYKWPDDLAKIYGGLDVVWAGDFMEAGYNSLWLLPNRLYEGGFYGTPSIAPAGAETAKWSEDRAVGFSAAEPLAESLPLLVEDLLAHPEKILERRQRLLSLPLDTFVQPSGEMRAMIDAQLAYAARRFGVTSLSSATPMKEVTGK